MEPEKITIPEKTRCTWCLGSDIYIHYHDTEWGVPVTDDRKLFEFLTLDGAQAGLSWLTILKKREGYREAFCHWDVEAIARMGEKDVARLKENPAIVRNRLKIESTLSNARAYLEVLDSGKTFSDYLWQFVDGTTIQNRWQNLSQVPATTPESDAMSKQLKKDGFRFVGSTICYAIMQAAGMVNDHTVDCFRHTDLSEPA